MSVLVDRVLQIRMAGQRRSPSASRAYQNRLKNPRRVLETIESSSLPTGPKLETRRLFIVSVCAAFESFWRDIVRSTVAEIGVSDALRKSLRRQSFSLGDLTDVLGEELTLAELVSCSYTFQSPEVVNRALSEALSIDVFGEFRKARFALVEVPRENCKSNSPPARSEVRGEFALKKIPLIERGFKIRHETVHHVGHVHRPTYANVLEIENAVWIFNEFLGMFVGARILKSGKGQSNKALQRMAKRRR